MRVKKLEIFGFKSFAQKTTIHFEPGVTAIVGPNGSGKSNIVDSIRWVLGEHNPRDVRAPRLEDVIFNGTDRKAPLSVAEVHFTIDNEDGLLPISFTEVTLSRRVYRSGESECFINQSPCRLKDIQELFLGTGLGGGTYAIIEQGHIDMILSSKPEERRVVFEEASGVAKYLSKKQETMRRLDETEEHLLRIADIISEVRRQVGSLERAANKARQYKTQWEQLKNLELRLAVNEMRQTESTRAELESRLQALNAERSELETQKQRHMASLEERNLAVSATQQRLQDMNTKLVECKSHIDQHEAQRSLKLSWIEELAQQVGQLEQEAVQLRERMSQADGQLTSISGAETEIQTQLVSAQSKLAHSTSELFAIEAALQTATSAMNDAKAQLFAAASEASSQRNLLADTSSKLQSIDAQLTRLQEQRAKHTAQLEQTRAKREELLHERTLLGAQHDEIQSGLANGQKALDESAARRHELSGRLHQLRDQLSSERARVKLLEDLWRHHEGFPETVKALMQQNIEGLIGPLVDLIQAAPGYEDVIEAALGPLSDALVVSDRNALLRCRQMLSSKQLKSARFIVLEDCPAASEIAQEPVFQGGACGTVKQYLSTQPQYKPLIDWLLNDSWVVEDLQRILSERLLPQGRLVSRRGDRWDRRSWRFAGVKSAEHQSRLGRQQRWEQAQTTLAYVEKEFNDLDAALRKAEQDWQELISQQESTKAQSVPLASGLHRLDATANQLMSEEKRVADELRSLEMDYQQLSSMQNELRVTLAKNQEAVAEAQKRQQAIEQSLAESQEAREAGKQHQQELVVVRAQLDASLQTLIQRSDSLKHRRGELESDHDSILRQLETKSQQRTFSMARCEGLKTQLQDHEQQCEQLQQERLKFESEIEALSKTLKEEDAMRNEVLPHVLEVEQRLNTLTQEIQGQTQQASERAFRRTRLMERLRELYQIDEATIQSELNSTSTEIAQEQVAAMSEQIQKLRAKLEGMGPVSLGSVEEYDELKHRLEFLQGQQKDLTQAREDLKTSISQINRAARAQFRETFERIRQEFQYYYTRLFNGGEANLILMDEDDVLECGIDIVARPPGKRLQSISLLSGGERALTAISLLFALFKVRPSPFCILDEIDAPLDEANVDRFTRVLEEFLALSQFILITHNKKTITKADSLYGVTMEEAGISRILSAKLTKSSSDKASVSVPSPAAA